MAYRGPDNDKNATGDCRKRALRPFPGSFPRPLDTAALDALALAYVARFATSAARLAAYLQRKLRERGWDDGAAPDPAATVARMVERMVDLGFVDDRGFASARAGGLLRRGYGVRRIDETLARDGIDADIAAEARGSLREARQAALTFARRRRLGPFGLGSSPEALDRAVRERHIAAMMRAGHDLATARVVIDAPDAAAVEQWVDEDDA